MLGFVGHGTGRGLSQVFGFVKQSSGEVRVESTPGEGTTITLYLPRVEGSGSPVSVRQPGEMEALANGHGTRVLVVEDNADVGGFADQALAELGYVTTLVTDADQALAKLAGRPDGYDVVFSDVVVPGMNGIELAKEVRRRYGDLSIALVSGYSHVLAKHGTHGFDLLQKPYSVEQLSRTLRKLVRRSDAR